MRIIHNNYLNSVTFPKRSIDVSDSTEAKFRQFGGSSIVNVPITILFEDCCTVVYQIPLGENAIKNGMHQMDIVDSSGESLFSVTIQADQHDGADSYMIEDDGEETDYVYPQPTEITFSSALITFSNNNT